MRYHYSVGRVIGSCMLCVCMSMFDGKGLQPLPEMHPPFHGVVYLYLAA